MSRMQVASFNDVKIYNLTAGKALPQWFSDRQKRNLSKDESYRRRVELIQDLEFPTASQKVKMSPDGQYLVASGTYPPGVRIFEVQELSMKCERRLTAEVVDFVILSEDAGKLVLLQNDRTVAFHAPYGAHYATRIPKFGRCLAYYPPSCDLYIGGSSTEVYRLNLQEGRFQAPLTVRSADGVNKLAFNPVHMLLGTAGQDGAVEFFDPRSQTALSALDLSAALAAKARDSFSVTALEFDTDGLTWAAGTSSGHVLLYDLRSSRPLVVKEHQYGLPIVSVRFHGTSRKVLSADSKLLKIWDRDASHASDSLASSDPAVDSPSPSSSTRDRGAVLTNVETPAGINDVLVVADSRGDSGLVLMAAEQERVMAYYVPALGPAPRWCSFLDSITEELEEGEGGAVYDDYRFVTRQELEELNATNLIGTPLLKGYMHGFFMDVNLYAKLHAVSKPFAFDEWRKRRIREKLEEKRASRITIQKKLPQINRELAEKLLRNKKKKAPEGEEAEATVVDAQNPLGDDRFKSLFTREDFQVDRESEEFKLRNPSGMSTGDRRRKGRRDDDGSDDDLVDTAFTPVDEEEGDEALDVSSDDGDDDDDVDAHGDDDDMEVSYHPDSSRAAAKADKPRPLATMNFNDGVNKRKKGVRRPRFMEADVSGGGDAPMLLHDQSRREMAREKKRERSVPLAERMRAGGRKEVHGVKRGQLTKVGGGGVAREYTYTPKSRGRGGKIRRSGPQRRK